MDKLLCKYKNGNYSVEIYEDGTKIRETQANEFMPSFAENMDVTITHKCDGNCQFCYLGCSPAGKHADIMSAKFLDTLHAGQELAFNGNDLSHPDLIPFLKKLEEEGVFANMTVNQIHFEQHQDLIDDLIDKDLIRGLGISLKNPTKEFIEKVQKYPNAVIHTINGVFTGEDVYALSDNNLKILILGYKIIGRGVDYFNKQYDKIKDNQNFLYKNLDTMFHHFKVISFDNLAIKQLNVRRLLSTKEWEEFYMGDDGRYTFAIDLVNKTFSPSSLSEDTYPLMDDADKMFRFVRGK